MTRNDFKQLAKVRLRESRVLLQAKCYSGAYYLCGYVIECGLKACIAKSTRRFEFPDKQKAASSYSHELGKLLGVAELTQIFDQEVKANAAFEENWKLVKDWTEASRYEIKTEQKARELYQAVTDPNNGVLQWIKQYW